MGDIEYIRQPRKGKKILTGILIGIVVVFVFLANSFLVVTQKDEYKLIRQFGKVERIVDQPGLSFKTPFIEEAESLPKNVLIYDLATSDVITSDKKTMVADSYVLWRIADPLLFVQTLNSQISNAENRINTTVYNSLKNVISSMEQSEVISGRDGALSEAIMNNIGDTMKQYGIDLICVETKHLDLPSDNKTAVYERMISERNNQAAKYQADGESEATKIRTETDNKVTVMISEAQATAEKTIADGEAEYMKILSKAYSDSSRSDFYTFVRSLDAAKVMLQGNNKTLVLTPDSPIAQIFNNVQ